MLRSVEPWHWCDGCTQLPLKLPAASATLPRTVLQRSTPCSSALAGAVQLTMSTRARMGGSDQFARHCRLNCRTETGCAPVDFIASHRKGTWLAAVAHNDSILVHRLLSAPYRNITQMLLVWSVGM